MTGLVMVLLAATSASAGTGAPAFVESRIALKSDRFEHHLADVDGDRLVDLFVTSSDGSERTLRLWRQRPDATFPPEPDFRMSVPHDVVCWTLLDVRPDPGDELLLLTRGGVFALTTTQPGLQGNLRRELAMTLFPDLADPGRLPCWRLVEDVDGDGRKDLLVVTEAGGGCRLVALGVARQSGDSGEPGQAGQAEQAGRLKPIFEIECGAEIDEDATSTIQLGDAGINVRSRTGMQWLFPGSRSSRPIFQGERLFSQRRRFKIPALLDWNEDGKLDVVRFAGRAATVRRRLPDGTFEAKEETIHFPSTDGRPPDDDDGRRRERRAQADLVDCDGDGREELVLFRKEGDGFGKESVTLLYPRAADGTPADAPTARVKLGGMDVEWDFADVDGDGKLELLARTLDIPTGLTTLATIRLDVGFYVFRGMPGGQLSREPEIRFARSFRPEQLARVQESLLTKLDGDFDGDGKNDLVSTELDGRVEIRRVVVKDGALALEERPFASFVPPALVDRLETWDISDDDVADLLLRHEEAFTFFVSRKKGDR